MDRITNPGVVPDPRTFIEGNPETGTPATPLDVDWLNTLQEEICALIEHNGGTLDPASRTQLRDKILALVNNANAASVDGLPIEMAGAGDGFLLKVTGVAPNLQVVAVPASSVATPTTVATRWFDSITEVIQGTTYHKASSSAPTGSSTSLSNAISTANTENLVVEFASQATPNGFIILPGRWSFHLWDNANNTGTDLRIKIFDLDEATGTRTQIGVTHSYPVPNTVPEYSTYEVQADDPIIIAPGHRLVFSFYAWSASNNRTLTIIFNGADRQSYFEVPVAQSHNDLAGIQGGAGSERYHLTRAAAAVAEAMVANPPAGSARVDVFTTSGTWVKPEGAKWVHVLAVGAGGGGSSGRVAAVNTQANGGGGGGGGGLSTIMLSADEFDATCAVVVGVGGAGGAATSVSASSNNGQAGGRTYININANNAMYADRGYGGTYTGGGISGGSGSSGTDEPHTALFPGGKGGNPMVSAGDGGDGSGTSNGQATGLRGGAGGGGAGGGVTSANVVGRGGRGSCGASRTALNAGGAPGGNDGVNGVARSGYIGSGGSGGGASINSDGGNGGSGTYGGGGGGGGGTRDGFLSGAGGNGGDGIIVITTWS